MTWFWDKSKYEDINNINTRLFNRLIMNNSHRKAYMETIKLREDYIKLGQALKASGLVGSGVDAKFVIQDGLVKVNGATELQRGKKLYDGDLVEYNGESVKIEK